MSMLQYPLYDFLATVPSCVETSTLAEVLEIFEQEQCDRLVVVNQQQFPLGLLHSARLIPKLLSAAGGSSYLNFHQSLSTMAAIFEPIQTILASERLEKFSWLLRYQEAKKQQISEWILIDSDGKYLGLLDSVRLLQFLAKNHDGGVKTHSPVQMPYEHQRMLHKPLVQLLARLPWPLMLQTGAGKVVTQNPAWWEQLGILKDPEGVRQQVESILAPARTQEPEYSHHQIKVHPNGRGTKDARENSSPGMKLFSANNSPNLSGQNHPQIGKHISIIQEPSVSSKNSANHCFLDTQMGTCTCVVEIQNGQERIWQFAKIPLDSAEFKVLSSNAEVTLNRTDDLWLVLATDVTEQQQLCKELAAKNADLIQLNRLKDEFLACISHELKTPLTAVLGLSRLLIDQQLGKLNERQARYAGLIHQSGRHLMSVVNDILDLTRMETGQMELALTPVTIETVCDRALTEVKNLHSQNSKTTHPSLAQTTRSPNHQFSLYIEPGLDQIVADELRLRQMLVHLLSNAFKFTEVSGEIGLRVNRWEGWIAFTVWDTGIGIPEHQQHLIFQKFQQLENPLTRQFEGTGLGLVLTRALARLHGGDVSFLSREGKGSQFTLLLPPSPPKTSFTESEGIITDSQQHQPIFSQQLVLVVEAVARYIEDITEHLKGLGYRVIIARSGTEALEKARRLQPKVIFLNPLLPLLSGWDVLTLLKSDAASRHIPVIITATAAEKEHASANRADGFLSLPVEQPVLAPLLERLCTSPENQQLGSENNEVNQNKTPLRILRLVNPELESINLHPSLKEHRVIEVDDLDQAELLARVWQFDVILLDVESYTAQTYLQKLIQHPRLAALPLVTCDVATTLAASQIPGLCVFPCLTPFNQEKGGHKVKTDTLLSVLQIASGVFCPPNIVVVDVTMLRDLPQVRRKQAKNYKLEKNASLNDKDEKENTSRTERGSEWFQALIQYLQTAGFKAAIGNCWGEVLQQIRHRSVDLLLIYLSESSMHKDVQKALKSLGDLSFNLPPILILDQRLSQVNYVENGSDEITTVLTTLSAKVLPRSISMEDLLNQINQALVSAKRKKS
ncbi:ATP-binding protein [Cronbergia sp. UHCC 0137]|uniref:ATP-binding response regulator n=1 Tax=Cronbergia sp. UHCC 0137 TaxID=3110239 RepID=UPI002B1FA536|nr:ATP-binding protein [Cronbergia sp. UHCC 0137]MEA5617834.1 ATP-binding protein [Cronbergia sp. UHCC 0137]